MVMPQPEAAKDAHSWQIPWHPGPPQLLTSYTTEYVILDVMLAWHFSPLADSTLLTMDIARMRVLSGCISTQDRGMMTAPQRARCMHI